MPARILLVRHGRSAHATRGWLSAGGVHDWLAAYDVAGLAPEQQPPSAVRAAATAADVIVASDLPRALASAALLAPDTAPLVSPLLREATMVIPRWDVVRLPLLAWAVVLGARWLYGARRDEAAIIAARDQGVAAAAWLSGLALPDRVVVAVTHHTIRGCIARALLARGWRHDRATDDRARTRTLRQRYAHWSAWPMSHPAARAPER